QQEPGGNMRRRLSVGLLTSACAASALLLSSWALAGSKTNFPVLVNTTQMMAAGNLGTARNGADNLQLLGCQVNADSTGVWGSCIARNAAGSIGSCVSVDPGVVDAMRALNGDSYLEFHWNSTGFCTSVKVWNSSDDEPKLP